MHLFLFCCLLLAAAAVHLRASLPFAYACQCEMNSNNHYRKGVGWGDEGGRSNPTQENPLIISVCFAYIEYTHSLLCTVKCLCAHARLFVVAGF